MGWTAAAFGSARMALHSKSHLCRQTLSLGVSQVSRVLLPGPSCALQCRRCQGCVLKTCTELAPGLPNFFGTHRLAGAEETWEERTFTVLQSQTAFLGINLASATSQLCDLAHTVYTMCVRVYVLGE